MWQDVVHWLLAAHLLVVCGAVMMLLLTVRMLRQQRNPSASVAWLLFLILLPYVGVPAYLFFGSRKFLHVQGANAPPAREVAQAADRDHDTVRRFLHVSGVPPAMPAGNVRFHSDANEARTSLIRHIEAARECVDVCLFLLADDPIGRELCSLLTEKASQGVRVRLLLDGVGSFLLPKRRLSAFQCAGGEVSWFVPLFRWPFRGRINLRNHRKLAVMDRAFVWTGGRNVGEDYLVDERKSQWWDLSFEFGGDAVLEFQRLFESDWAFAKGLSVPEPLPPRHPCATPSCGIQLVPSGPDMAQDVLHDLLVILLANARRRVVLVTPYFVPDEVLQTMLRLSVQRGVEVDLILPRRSNHRLADLARGRALRELATAGARIWLLPEGMLHAKAVLVDDDKGLAGSANLDCRSMMLNFEMMALFHEPDDVASLSAWIDELRARCSPWQPVPPGMGTQIVEGLVLLAAFQL